MDFGGAFKAAWNAASDAGREAAAAIGTGLKKVGDAAYEGAVAAAEATVDAAKWAAERTAEAAEWVTEKAEQGLDKAVELAKETAEVAEQAIKDAANAFVAGAKALGSYLLCKLKPDPLSPEEQARAKELLDRLSAEDARSLSALAYDGEVGDLSDNGQWRVIDVRETGLTGYRTIVAESTNPNDPRKVLSFAGTDVSSFGSGVTDVLTDIDQHLGGVPPQYLQALGDASELQAQYGDDLVITGHSLGGGMGNFASETLGVPAVTINSAPLGTGAQGIITVFGPDNQGSNSLTLATGNDVVSVIGTAGSPAHPGLVAPVASTTGGNPLSDHMLDSFDPGAVELEGYDGPAVPAPPTSPPMDPVDPGSDFPTFD